MTPAAPTKPLTEDERKVLDYVTRYKKREGVGPTAVEVGDSYVGPDEGTKASKTAWATRKLNALVKRGMVWKYGVGGPNLASPVWHPDPPPAQ